MWQERADPPHEFCNGLSQVHLMSLPCAPLVVVVLLWLAMNGSGTVRVERNVLTPQAYE